MTDQQFAEAFAMVAMAVGQCHARLSIVEEMVRQLGEALLGDSHWVDASRLRPPSILDRSSRPPRP